MNTKHIKHYLHTNKRVLIVGAILLALLIYAGVNAFVFRYAKSGAQKSALPGIPTQQSQAGSSPSLIERIQESGKSAVEQLKKLGGAPANPVNPEPVYVDTGKSLSPRYTPMPPQPSPTPNPVPRQGSGKYACSKEGVCNLYSDQALKDYCTVTYADSNCLGQCGDTAKRCIH